MGITLPDEYFETIHTLKEEGVFDDLSFIEGSNLRSHILLKYCTEPDKMEEFIEKAIKIAKENTNEINT